MNLYKAALVFKSIKDGLVTFEKRTLTINALDEREAFQTLLIKAAQVLIQLQQSNESWEYIGLYEFESLDIAPLHIESIHALENFNDMESFINDIKQYVEELTNKIGHSA